MIHPFVISRAGLLYLFDNGIAPYVSYSTSFSPDENGDLLAPKLPEHQLTLWTGYRF